MASQSIAAKEMLPIVLAAAIWGSYWRGGTVRIHCDNSAAVDVLNNQSARDPLLCHHLRSWFFIGARFDFDMIALNTPGTSNLAADTLSRDNLPFFRSQVLHAADRPTPLPTTLARRLSVTKPAWTLQHWTRWLDSSLTKP